MNKFLEIELKPICNTDLFFSFNYFGVKIDLSNTKQKFLVSLTNTNGDNVELLSIFFKLYELFYFMFGIFLEILNFNFDKKTYSKNNKNNLFVPQIYKVQENIHIYNLIKFEKIKEISDFEMILQNWIISREKLNLQINSFLVSISKSIKETGYIEISIALLLQSMEGFVTSCLKNHLLYQSEMITLKSESKNEIPSYIKKISNELKKEEIENQILYIDKIKIMIEPYKKIILKREMEANRSKNCQIFNTYEEFLNKCHNTRNYISHIDIKEKIFAIDEIQQYIEKLKMIYRLNILKLLNLEKYIDYEIIDNNILLIDELLFKTCYLKNNEKCKKCKNLNNCKYELYKIKSLN